MNESYLILKERVRVFYGKDTISDEAGWAWVALLLATRIQMIELSMECSIGYLDTLRPVAKIRGCEEKSLEELQKQLRMIRELCSLPSENVLPPQSGD